MQNDRTRETAIPSALASLLGPSGFTDDSETMAPWLTDWRGRYHGAALGMASPATPQELAQIVTLAAAHGVALVPQGGNSGMVGGATPDSSGTALIVSLRRMAAVRRFDADARQITVEAGMILQNLHDWVAEKDLRFPLTLGGKGSATVGGLVATNAGGTQVLRHGTMRALVDGIEAVLPDGTLFEGLNPLKKDNRGYDLKHLLIGSEGTLGFVTAATLRLVPALIDRAVIWAGVESPSAARRLLLHCEAQAGAAMEGFEILPQHCLQSVLRHIPGTRDPLPDQHPWHVLIELVQDSAEAPSPRMLAETVMAAALERDIAQDAVISTSEAQAEAFWKIRDSIAEAERADGPALQHDISVPVAQMAEFIETASPKVEHQFPGCRAVAFGHLGDGNVHFHVRGPDDADRISWPKENEPQISPFVFDLVTQAGGSISAEHGIGQVKRGELLRLSDPARLTMLRAIKQALDPHGIMNPGKLVPPCAAPA